MPRRDEDYDQDDREAPPRPRRREEDDEDDYDEDRGGDDNPMSYVVPYKNGMALGAYYCGVFSIIPGLGNVLGPIAFILGILGWNYAKKHPTAHGTGHAIFGIIAGLITTLLWWGGVVALVIIAIAVNK
jgi:hypothetical protein